MTDAQTIMDHQDLQRDADHLGFDIKIMWIDEAYKIGIFGRKENGFSNTSAITWFHTLKEAHAWVMG